MLKEKIDLKALSKKERIGYIWDYYRFHILFSVVGIVMVCSLVSNWINYKKPILDIIMVNNGTVNRVDRSEGDELSGFDGFLKAYGYEVYDNAVYVDSSLYFTGDVKDYDTA